MARRHGDKGERTAERNASIETKDELTPDDAGDEERLLGSFNRRSILKMSGLAATGLAATGGVGGIAEPASAFEVRTVVNAVDDLGMDPTGDEPIQGRMPVESDLRIEFPPGTYLFTGTVAQSTSVDNFEIVGLGDAPGDVTFRIPEGVQEYFVNLQGVGNVRLENFRLEQNDGSTDGITTILKTRKTGIIRDVIQGGFSPRDDLEDDLTTGFTGGKDVAVAALERDAVVILERFVDAEGGIVSQYPNRRIGVWVSSSHVGEVTFRDCRFVEGGASCVYGTRHYGCVRIEGGLYKNNDNTQIRVAGSHPSKRSWIRDARVVMDYNDLTTDIRGDLNGGRGIWVESRNYWHSGLLIENCDIIIRDAPAVPAAIDVREDHGSVEIRNCRVNNQVGSPCIRAHPALSRFDDAEEVKLDGCSFTGTGGPVVIDGRSDSSMRNLCLELSNSDGIIVRDASGVTLADSNINVSGRATVFSDAAVSTSNLTYDESCPLPGGNNSGPTSLPHTIEITGTGTATNYQFTVSEEVRAGSDVERWDTISGTAVNGWVTETTHTDTFEFAGELLDFAFVTGDADVTVDGEPYDTSTTRGSTIELVGTGVATNYQFSVSGSLQEADGSLEPWDSISETTADGWVTDPEDRDAYLFTGEVTDFQFLEGSARVLVNGTEVDPTTLGVPSLENTIRISGGTADDPVSYVFAVDGDLEAASGVESDDGVSGSTAAGQVVGDSDSYAFSGSVVTFSTDGDVTVTVNGAAVDESTWQLPNRVVLDGATSSDPTTYEFTVTGSLERDPAVGGLESDDAIESGTARGSVAGDVDAYRFTGDLSRLVVDGNASVRIEDNDG